MRAYLIVNGFLIGNKYNEIYDLITTSFKNRGVEIDVVLADKITSVSDFKVKPDFVMFWDKDFYLASKLESEGVRLFNSAKAMLYCDNKILTYKILEKEGLSIPKTIVAPKTFENVGYPDLSFVDRAGKKLGYPMIIKEAHGSFGMQVYLVENASSAKDLASKLSPKDFIFQEFIKSSKGRDVRVNVVGESVVSAIFRSNENDFRSNVTLGGSKRGYEPDENMKSVCIRAVKALGLDFAGVDVMFKENGQPIICEVNSNPHFKSSLEATGINLADKIAEYVIGKIC